MEFILIWAIALVLHYLNKRIKSSKQEQREEYVEEKEKITQNYDNQLKYINHKLSSLYNKRKDWDVYDSIGIKDTKGNLCKKEDCVEYLKIQNDIEILENKKRRLESKCN